MSTNILSPQAQAAAIIRGGYTDSDRQSPEFQALVDYLGESSTRGEANWSRVQAEIWRQEREEEREP